MVALAAVRLDSICRDLRCAVLLLDPSVRAAPRVELTSLERAPVMFALEPTEAARALRHVGPVAVREFPLRGVDGDSVAVSVVTIGPFETSPNAMSVMVYIDAMDLYGAIVILDLRRGSSGWVLHRRESREG